MLSVQPYSFHMYLHHLPPLHFPQSYTFLKNSSISSLLSVVLAKCFKCNTKIFFFPSSSISSSFSAESSFCFTAPLALPRSFYQILNPYSFYFLPLLFLYRCYLDIKNFLYSLCPKTTISFYWIPMLISELTY